MTMPAAVVEATGRVLARRPPHGLSETEARRAARLRHVVDRDDFVAARWLARELVGRALGRSARQVSLHQVCADCGGPHGRPFVGGGSGLHVSWSHGGGVVAAVVASQPCGVDVELIRPVAVIERVLTAAEQAFVASCRDPERAFLQLWTRKEALVKTGAARLDEIGAIDVLTGPWTWLPVAIPDDLTVVVSAVALTRGGDSPIP